MGQGVLDVSKDILLNMEMPIVIKNEMEAPTESICNREIFSIFKECGIDPKSDTPIEEQEPVPLPDRKALDDVIFDALDLTEEERKDVYRAVCRLVWNRISKAKNK